MVNYLPGSLFGSKSTHCLLDRTLNCIASLPPRCRVRRSRKGYYRCRYCHNEQIVWLWGLVGNMTCDVVLRGCVGKYYGVSGGVVSIKVWQGVLVSIIVCEGEGSWYQRKFRKRLSRQGCTQRRSWLENDQSNTCRCWRELPSLRAGRCLWHGTRNRRYEKEDGDERIEKEDEEKGGC